MNNLNATILGDKKDSNYGENRQLEREVRLGVFITIQHQISWRSRMLIEAITK